MSSMARSIELIQFGCARRTFCIDVDQVLGVISLPPHLTEAPPVMPFQGETVRVYPLESAMEIDPCVRYAPPEVIVLKGDPCRFGIAVDWVGEIHRVLFQRSVFRFPHADASRVKMFGVWGMATLGKTLALVLEPWSLLARVQERDPIAEALPVKPPIAPQPSAPL